MLSKEITEEQKRAAFICAFIVVTILMVVSHILDRIKLNNDLEHSRLLRLQNAEQREKDRQLDEKIRKIREAQWKWEQGFKTEQYGTKPGCDGKGYCKPRKK